MHRPHRQQGDGLRLLARNRPPVQAAIRVHDALVRRRQALRAPASDPAGAGHRARRDGHDWSLVYTAYGTGYRSDTTSARSEYGVVFPSDIAANGTPGAMAEVRRGEAGAPRGSSQNNLAGEFLGDYVYAVGTRDY